MAKLGIFFWTGTGNTQVMAEAIAEGAKSAGAEVDVFNISEDKGDYKAYDLLAFGCPAMGAEELEDSEFEPFFADLEGDLSGRKVALFGSYSWAEGEWMQTWAERVRGDGAVLFKNEGLIAYDLPDDAKVEECKAFGAEFANA